VKSRKAFSLLELSVVLVIIGILFVAVLKGKSLIVDAAVKRDFTNYVMPLKEDFTLYREKALEVKGYEEVLGDGKDNGGQEDSTDGFIDTDTDNKTVENLLGYIANYSGVRILTNYNGTQKPYSTSLLDRLETVDDDMGRYKVGNGDEGYLFVSAKHHEVHLYFGADTKDESGNFLVIYGIDVPEYMIYDRLADGDADGSSGDFLILGVKMKKECESIDGDTCKCFESGIYRYCYGKGAEGGCRVPTCGPSQVLTLVAGWHLK